MNDNLSPSLAPIPFEIIGKPGRRASELERDRAAIELAAYVISILKFDPAAVGNHGAELLKRANKVRRSQGNGEVVFVADTAERIRAAADPDFEVTEAEVARLMSEPIL
jgi:hypothetical protein